mmetsp:Transcript_31990/g.96302  ORF Transcript_31990/g.96302 Transcript_31990/m.96302 type:complete len:236 (+) Transcript_31990:870-1577(+)
MALPPSPSHCSDELAARPSQKSDFAPPARMPFFQSESPSSTWFTLSTRPIAAAARSPHELDPSSRVRSDLFAVSALQMAITPSSPRAHPLALSVTNDCPCASAIERYCAPSGPIGLLSITSVWMLHVKSELTNVSDRCRTPRAVHPVLARMSRCSVLLVRSASAKDCMRVSPRVKFLKLSSERDGSSFRMSCKVLWKVDALFPIAPRLGNIGPRDGQLLFPGLFTFSDVPHPGAH